MRLNYGHVSTLGAEGVSVELGAVGKELPGRGPAVRDQKAVVVESRGQRNRALTTLRSPAPPPTPLVMGSHQPLLVLELVGWSFCPFQPRALAFLSDLCLWSRLPGCFSLQLCLAGSFVPWDSSRSPYLPLQPHPSK